LKSQIKDRSLTQTLYRRPKFLTVLHEIREAMSREADYDVDLFAEMVRSGARPKHGPVRNIRGQRKQAPRNDEVEIDATPMNGRRRAS